jgi:1-acyl-sn-glycerol-3-phosphate acyltransferase
MSNHQSHLDIPILFSVFPGRLRMVAKAELFKVQLWGRAMKAAGFVALPTEWWHFDAPDAAKYTLSDEPL